MHGVLAGAGAVEKEEVGWMGGGNGSLLVEVVWAWFVLFFAPQLYKSTVQTKPV